MASRTDRSSDKVSKLSFEERLARLQEIVERLEDGTLGLEESLALFEEAVLLGKGLRELLDAASLRIKTLSREMGRLTDDTSSSNVATGEEVV